MFIALTHDRSSSLKSASLDLNRKYNLKDLKRKNSNVSLPVPIVVLLPPLEEWTLIFLIERLESK